MITLDVTQEGTPLAAYLTGFANQVPFALSKAINLTVDKAQDAVQAALPGEFHLRRAQYVENTIYRKPGQDFATKQNLVGAVRVNPERDILAKFEDGGEKQSISGKSLAVPVVRLDQPDLIIQRSDPLNIKTVMNAIANAGGKIGKKQRGRKLGPVRQQASASVYLIKSGGKTFVIQRTGPTTTRVLYAFEKQVPIMPQLNFDEIAMRAALASWDQNMADAIEYAMATAK